MIYYQFSNPCFWWKSAHKPHLRGNLSTHKPPSLEIRATRTYQKKKSSAPLDQTGKYVNFVFIGWFFQLWYLNFPYLKKLFCKKKKTDESYVIYENRQSLLECRLNLFTRFWWIYFWGIYINAKYKWKATSWEPLGPIWNKLHWKKNPKVSLRGRKLILNSAEFCILLP